MADDLRLTSNEYSIALVVFFVTYVAFEPGSNMILVRWKPSLYLPTIMAIWGGLTCVMAAIQDFHHLVVLRIFVGVFEAGFGMIHELCEYNGLLTTTQPLVFSLLFHPGTSVTNNPSALVFTCQLLFFLAASVGCWQVRSPAVWRAQQAYVDGDGESPHTEMPEAEADRKLGCSSSKASQQSSGLVSPPSFSLISRPTAHVSLSVSAPSPSHVYEMAASSPPPLAMSVWARSSPSSSPSLTGAPSVSSWATWYASRQSHHLARRLTHTQVIVGSSTLSYFYPTLVSGLGYTNRVQAQYMTTPIYAVAFVCTAITTYFADRVSNHRGLLISSWLAFALITAICVCTIYDFKARYALLVLMAAGLWSSNALALSFASATFGDMEPEVRAIALALVNAMGNLAQIYGAYLFPAEDKPKYLMGFGVISGMLGFGTFVYIFMHVAVRRSQGMGWF